MILLVQRDRSDQEYSFDLRRLNGKSLSEKEAKSLLAGDMSPHCEYLRPMLERRIGAGTMTFSDHSFAQVLKKIKAGGNFSLRKNEVAQGIVGPQDTLNRASLKRLGSGFRLGEGIFNLTNAEVRKLKLPKEEKALLKPLYTSHELGRYYGQNKSENWIIYTGSEFQNRKAIDPFPLIREHLDRFAKIITSSNKPYGLHRARNEEFFKGEKIVSLRKCVAPQFTYTDFPCYVAQTFNVIKTSRVNPKYLTALLNSRLICFWLRHKGKMQGNHFQVDKEPLLALPLRIPPKQKQAEIATLVDKVLRARSQLDAAETDSERAQVTRVVDEYEGRVDAEIADIYGLDERDRNLIVSAY